MNRLHDTRTDWAAVDGDEPALPPAEGEESGTRAARPSGAQTRGDRELQGLLAALTAEAEAWVAVLDFSGAVRGVSPAVTAMLGYRPDEVLVQGFFESIAQDDKTEVSNAIANVEKQIGSRSEVRYRRRRLDGRELTVSTVFVNRLDHPLVAGVVATTRTVEAEPLLPPLAPDRGSFLHLLQKVMDNGTDWALLVIDVHDFRNVVNGLGPANARRLLDTIAGRIRQSASPGEVAVVGDQQFGVLISDGADEDRVRGLAERIGHRLRMPTRVANQEVLVSARFGLVTPHPEQGLAEDVLAQAEAAAQQATRRRVVKPARYRATLQAMHRRRLLLAAALPRAVQRSQLTVRYQPIVHLESGRITGFEALLRWVHPELGVISPEEFIPLAEELDLVMPLDRWVLEESARQVATWPSSEPFLINVNVSARDLDDPLLVHTVSKALGSSGLRPDRLRLEITETAIPEGSESSAQILRAVKDLGVGLAMDDFGTGYATFRQLADMPLDALKMDRSFVSRIDRDERGRALVHAMVAMAHRLGVQVVGEGVETAEQLALLRDMGCDYGQGYFFAPPGSAAEACFLLSSGTRW